MPEKKGGHITLDDRRLIEDCINHGLGINATAKRVGVHPSTITREILGYRAEKGTHYFSQNGNNICIEKTVCRVKNLCNSSCLQNCSKCRKGLCNQICHNYKPEECVMLDKPPFVCNVCPQHYGFGCGKRSLFYDAVTAHERARNKLVESRSGISISEESLKRMVATIKPLLAKGQSLEHIWATHRREFPVSVRTFYNYIDMGAISIINIDLPKKVKYKIRKKKSTPKALPHDKLDGRTYEDFMKLSTEEQIGAVEMDCVEGRQGEKQTILTLLFRRTNFQIMILLPAHDQQSVIAAIDKIEELCSSRFSMLFSVILTDRGHEFLDFDSIERSAKKEGERRTRVYYCDPMCSWQKPQCEKNHTEIRAVLPKGSSFRHLTQEMVSLVCSHVNGFTRAKLGGLAPYTLAATMLPKKLLDGFGITAVSADDVTLHPSLLDHFSNE